jgi:two-component system, cell cycle sensor histidine kinase and response regulator CckA
MPMIDPPKPETAKVKPQRSPLWMPALVIVIVAVLTEGIVLFGPNLGLVPDVKLLAAIMAALAAIAALIVLAIERQQGAHIRDWQLLTETLEDAQIGRALVAENGRTVHSNGAFWRLLQLAEGKEPEAALTTAFTDNAAEFTRVQKSARDGQYAATELLRRPEGLPAQCLLVEAWPSKQHKGYIAWRIEDITPRQQVQEAIRAEQAKWADFMDRAPVGFFSVDGEGKFTYANATLTRWLGTSPKSTGGR